MDSTKIVIEKRNDDFEPDQSKEQHINHGQDDQMQIFGYQRSLLKTTISWLLIVISCGLVRLVFYWKPKWMLYCTHQPSAIDTATMVLLINKYEQDFVEKIVDQSDPNKQLLVPTSNGHFAEVDRLRWFSNKKTHYIWNFKSKEFKQLNGLDFEYIQCTKLCTQQGLDQSQQSQRLSLFGENVIDIKVQPVFKILVVEVLNPFYIYQLLAIIFWAVDHYYYYSGYIAVVSCFSLILGTYQIRVNQQKLREKVHGFNDILVLRANGKSERISSVKLVPGDIIEFDKESASELHCDAVLLNGEVIVDESMLTGESNPVTKVAIRNTDDIYDHQKEAKHILFAGTRIVQARSQGLERTRALVVRTNFQTAKGDLVKSILYPKPIDFKFNRHINHFLLAMGVLSLAGFIYTITLKLKRNEAMDEVFFKAIDLIAIVVPPELPAVMMFAIIYAEKRLKSNRIYCLSSRAINISGCIDCLVFDKTGTLTENDIDLEEVRQVETSSTSNKPIFSSRISQSLLGHHVVKDVISRCLASCHSLKLLDDNFIGESLEIKLFQSTNWSFSEPTNSVELYGFPVSAVVTSPNSDVTVGVLKQFPFTSNTARMSVVCKRLDKIDDNEQLFEFFIKGAPEIIVTKCKPETVPENFGEMLNEYARKSYRVLAIASKQLTNIDQEKVAKSEMKDYETDLVFQGLIVMRNKLKSETLKTIHELNEANIRVLMATGDNLFTAISVSRECGFVGDLENVVILEADLDTARSTSDKDRPSLKLYNHMNDSTIANTDNNGLPWTGVLDNPNDRYKLAMTGHTFRVLREFYPELMPRILVRCCVYARMAPEQKQQLVEMLQSIGHYVGMCGDGANDCGALKVAHAGISLSDTEASVASPFTSANEEISCVIDLLKEGRSSLVSVFGIMRFMTCYNITTFLALCILYYYFSALTDIQNLYQDIAIISIYTLLFSRNHPHKTLSPIRPPTSLIGVTQFSSIFLQLALVGIAQFSTVWYLHAQPWFRAHNLTEIDEEDDASYVCHDNYAIFIVQLFQYAILVINFSKGAPYRQPIYKNKLLMLALVLSMLLSLYIVVIPEYPFPGFARFFNLDYEDFPVEFRLKIVAIAVINLVLALFVEKFIVEEFIMKLVRKYKKSPFCEIYQASTGLDWLAEYRGHR